MSRWEPDTKQRLKQVAMGLFENHGFEATTIADIAKGAGLTERTFFRYFADKREVLFDGSEVLVNAYKDTITSSSSVVPMELVSEALLTVGGIMESHPGRAAAIYRQRIIMANPELQERELLKMNHLSDVISKALQQRGIERTTANLAADTAMSIFKNAFVEWVQSDAHTLNDYINNLLKQFHSLTIN